MISIKTRVHQLPDGRRFVKLPAIRKHHCNMSKARVHPELGTWANSDLFEQMLGRALARQNTPRDIFEGVTHPGVTVSGYGGFMATVTIEVLCEGSASG